ncbi:hypothetical protein, partial [Serratia nevei]|uniref:hypothetical protein n=1 Tax=Serratia nevei TaxID=2703794 RepID=UPI00313EF3C1
MNQEYAERFPAILSRQLDELAEKMEKTTSEEWLPVMGQQLEELGLALVEQWENWTDPTLVDKFCPHDEARSKASGLTP